MLSASKAFAQGKVVSRQRALVIKQIQLIKELKLLQEQLDDEHGKRWRAKMRKAEATSGSPNGGGSVLDLTQHPQQMSKFDAVASFILTRASHWPSPG